MCYITESIIVLTCNHKTNDESVGKITTNLKIKLSACNGIS